MKQLKDFQPASSDIADSELVRGVVGKYEDMDEDALTAELIKAVRRAKEDGSFSEESLEEFVSLVSPHLNDMQQNKLKNLISVIKIEE